MARPKGFEPLTF